MADDGEEVSEEVFVPAAVAQWAGGDNRFASDPPNAVRSFVPDEGEVRREAVVVL